MDRKKHYCLQHESLKYGVCCLVQPQLDTRVMGNSHLSAALGTTVNACKSTDLGVTNRF